MRWQIEVFHKVLKSGCQVLQCRLRTADRLIRYVAVMTIAAWRIFWMTIVSRNAPDLKPSAVITAEEMQAIRLSSSRKNRRIKSTSASNDWIREIAKLGGFLARKSDGDPGPLVLWRGYLRLQDIMLGISLVPDWKMWVKVSGYAHRTIFSSWPCFSQKVRLCWKHSR